MQVKATRQGQQRLTPEAAAGTKDEAPTSEPDGACGRLTLPVRIRRVLGRGLDSAGNAPWSKPHEEVAQA